MTAKDDIDKAAHQNSALAIRLLAAWNRGDVDRARFLLEKQIQQMSILRANLFSMEEPDADR